MARKLGSEWALYDTRDSSLHVINRTAEFVWRLCDGNHTLKDIAGQVSDEFQVKDETGLEGDLDGIIRKFHEIGVLDPD